MGKSKIWMIFDIVINVLLVILLTTSIILTLTKDELKDYKDELTALKNWKLWSQETTDFEGYQAGFEIELLNR